MPIQSRYRHTLVVKRMAPVGIGGAETVGGANTTLTADVAVGSSAITVASAASVAPGDWLRVGDADEREVRQVAPGGVAGLIVTLTAALMLAHDTGDVVRELDDDGLPLLDDYNQPVFAPTTVASVPGLIQPRSAREVALTSQGGAVIGSHVGYCDPTSALTTDAWIELLSPADMAGRYDILSRPDAAGLSHHLELALQAVT